MEDETTTAEVPATEIGKGDEALAESVEKIGKEKEGKEKDGESKEGDQKTEEEKGGKVNEEEQIFVGKEVKKEGEDKVIGEELEKAQVEQMVPLIPEEKGGEAYQEEEKVVGKEEKKEEEDKVIVEGLEETQVEQMVPLSPEEKRAEANPEEDKIVEKEKKKQGKDKVIGEGLEEAQVEQMEWEQEEGEYSEEEHIEGEKTEEEYTEGEHTEGEHTEGEHTEEEHTEEKSKEYLGEGEVSAAMLGEEEEDDVTEAPQEVEEEVVEEEIPPDPAAPYDFTDSKEALKAPFSLRPDQLSELEQLWEIYQNYTPAYTDLNYFITEVELVYLLKCLNLMTHTPEQMQELIEYCVRPPHPKGHIFFDQFVKMVTIRQRDVPIEEEIRLAVMLLDPEQTGLVEREVFRDVITNRGLKMTSKQANALVKEVDVLNDGTLRVEDVVGTLCIDLNRDDIDMLLNQIYPPEEKNDNIDDLI